MAQLIHSVLPVPLRKIVYIHPSESITQCMHVMVEQDIGALVVMDDDSELKGIVTERDIVRSCFNKQLNPETALVSDVMCSNLSILSSHDHVEKAMQVITATKRRYVLIKDDNALLAILSIGDLLFYLLEVKSREIEHLENYIHS